MRAMFSSMVFELNVGRYSAGMYSAWFTTWSFGWAVSSHAGRCPHVMKWMRRTHGAKRSTPRNQYRSVRQSR